MYVCIYIYIIYNKYIIYIYLYVCVRVRVCVCVFVCVCVYVCVYIPTQRRLSWCATAGRGAIVVESTVCRSRCSSTAVPRPCTNSAEKARPPKSLCVTPRHYGLRSSRSAGSLALCRTNRWIVPCSLLPAASSSASASVFVLLFYW
jgi:hypothetical protein